MSDRRLWGCLGASSLEAVAGMRRQTLKRWGPWSLSLNPAADLASPRETKPFFIMALMALNACIDIHPLKGF